MLLHIFEISFIFLKLFQVPKQVPEKVCEYHDDPYDHHGGHGGHAPHGGYGHHGGGGGGFDHHGKFHGILDIKILISFLELGNSW